MRVLLDTNVAIWMATEPALLRTQALDLVLDDETTLLLSAVTPWEIVIKWAIGKLELPEHPRDWVARLSHELAVKALPISQSHAVQVADLPEHHRDPFDRLLIAQAQVEGIPIVTADSSFARYDVAIVAAR